MRRSVFIFFATVILLGGAYLRLAELHRYPPGLHYDEAADMLLGRDIAWYDYRPFPVVTAYSGREVLFYYLSVPLLRIFGTNVMATRLTSAFLGILTVAATIALGRALFRKHAAGQALALMAGAWLAVNGPQVWLTRQGFRTSPQPFLEALCLWLLFVALNRRKRWIAPAILGGFFGGLALYVYMAARVFPPWLLIPLALLIVMDRQARGLRLRQVAVFLTALVITALPIVVFYVQNPGVLFDRLAQVAPSGQTITLLDSLRLHLGMFFIQGDPLLRYNLYPGRPFYDPISGLLMLIGLAIAAYLLLIARQSPMQKTGAAFLLFCPLLIAPSVIAVGGLPPSHMRSVAMVPLIFFSPALGAVGIVRLFRWRRNLVYAALGLLLVALGLNTWGDYLVWGGRADVFYQSDGDLNLAAQWLEHNAGPDDLIYIASQYYEHPTVLAHNLNPVNIRWMMADQLFLPPPGRRAIYIIPRSVSEQIPLTFLADYRITAENGPDGQPAYQAFRIEPGKAPTIPAPEQDTDANFGGLLRLHGADLPAAKAGESATVTLYWEVQRAPDRADLAPIVSLTDAWGNEISRAYPYFEHTDRLLPGEQFLTQVKLDVPTGNPPGLYTVRVEWVKKDEQNGYISLLDAEGRFAGVWATAGAVQTIRGDPAQVDLPAGLEPVVPGVYVLEKPTLPSQIEQGDHLRFTVRWLAQQTPEDTGYLQVVTEESGVGLPLILSLGDPAHDTYPMFRWSAGEQVIDRYDIPIPPNMPPGQYKISLNVDKAPRPVFSQTVEIVAVQRNFTPPLLAHQVDLRFGDSIRLVGYEVTPVGANEVAVKVAWQATGTPDRDYTVFVHLNNPDGSIFSQHDSQPSRSTSRWIEGEVISDTYTLKTPPGAYRIELGLYVQDNGLRLPVRDADGQSLGDAVIIQDVNAP